MSRIRILIAAVVAVGLTLGFAGMASAASAGCGQCHGAYINDNHGGKTLMPGVPTYEDTKTPQAGDICNSNGRGLHGIHMNYSSLTYGKSSSGTTRGTCNYCHNKHLHENGFVEFSSMVPNAAARQAAGISGGRLLVSGAGIDANGLDITQMDGTASCTTACHKGTNATNQAKWGNYTSVSARLSCASCHNDSANMNGISVDPATGTVSGSISQYTLSSPVNFSTRSNTYSLKGHYVHLNGDWAHVKIRLGGYTTYLDAKDNSSCLFCHTDNRGDGKAAKDDGSVKAYPHAKDGTNVVPTNATVQGIANIALTSYDATTAANGKFGCTNLCHANSGSALGGKLITWDDTGASHCETCHNHTADATVNDQAGVRLSYAHSLHFAKIPTDMGRNASCSDCHVDTHANNYAGTPGITELPVRRGTAGLLATMNWSRAGQIAVDGTCQNSCHIIASPVWSNFSTIQGANGCSTCHNYPGVTGRDWTGSNGHMARAKTLQNATTPVIRRSIKHLNVATAYNALTDTYAGVTGDVKMCGKCHNGASTNHINGTVNVVDSNSNGQCNGTSFTYNNISSNPANRIVNCSNVSCHFGKTTPNWF